MLQAYSDSPELHQVREIEVVELPPHGKKKTGRPLRMTEARFRRMLELIRAGNTNTATCRIEGVTCSTWRDHIQKKPHWQAEPAKAERIRDEIWRDYALEVIRNAMPKHWVCAMTYLERKYPLEFSLRTPNRPPNPADEPEQVPLPAAILEKHRQLQLQLLSEDAEHRSTVVAQSVLP